MNLHVCPITKQIRKILISLHIHAVQSVFSVCVKQSMDPKNINPFLPGNSLKGHRQTVQTQIRDHQTPYIVASDHGLHCLLIGFSIKNRIKATKET